jgi:hypothetical protein
MDSSLRELSQAMEMSGLSRSSSALSANSAASAGPANPSCAVSNLTVADSSTNS